MMHMKGVNYQGDIAVLFDWVFYHDALARFSLRHWKPAAPDKAICRGKPLVQSKRLDSLLRSQVRQTSPQMTSLQKLQHVCCSS